jgi:hypothetical protein
VRHTSGIHKLATATTFILVFFLFTRPPVDADFWWHLRAGQVMWTEQSILLSDVFSYTVAGAKWVNASWLSEVLLFLLYDRWGYIAISGFVAAIGAIAFVSIGRTLKGNPVLNAFVILLSALTAAPVWGPRPQIISFLMVAMLDGWLGRKKPAHLWYIVPFFILGANLHGGWVWGFLLLLAQLAGDTLEGITRKSKGLQKRILERVARLVVWTLLAVLAIGINPNGFSLWRLPFRQIQVSMQIQEWFSPDFHRLDFHPMLWMIFLLLVTSQFRRTSFRSARMFKVIGFAYLTFVAQRNIALFAIAAAPMLSQGFNGVYHAISAKRKLAEPLELPRMLRKVLNSLILLAISIASVARLITVSQPMYTDDQLPQGAVNWIEANQPKGRIFNSYNWGGYSLWTLPEYPVFIDGRADLYGLEIISQWQDVVHARDEAMAILDRWQVEIVFLEPGWPIIPKLTSNGWAVSYQDESSIILTRKSINPRSDPSPLR